MASLDAITAARAAALPGTAGSADLVLRNGRIFTGDPARRQAAALALSAGRITAVGDEADIAALAGPGTRVVDALGRRLIPGLNDSHIHLIRGGVNYLLELRWDGVSALSLALRMLREQAQRTLPGHWVRVVGGWTGAQFAGKRLPAVSELNAVAPDTPVLVLHLYQSAILNRAAITALGYTKDTPDPPGGRRLGIPPARELRRDDRLLPGNIQRVRRRGDVPQRHLVVLRPCRYGEPAVARAHRCSRRRHLRPEPHRYGR